MNSISFDIKFVNPSYMTLLHVGFTVVNAEFDFSITEEKTV